MQIAQRENVPAYIVCSNSTLRHGGKKAPETMDALLSVSGIGEVKACRYGETLSAIRNYQRGNSSVPTGSPKPTCPMPVKMQDRPNPPHQINALIFIKRIAKRPGDGKPLHRPGVPESL